MKTRVLVLRRGTLDAAGMETAVEILRTGGVAAYPTETLYGLGASAVSAEAADKIIRLKGRDPAQSFPLIASDLLMVKLWVEDPGPRFAVLARRFWPGPLTLVLRASGAVPGHILGPRSTVALRIPPLPWLRRLVRRLGTPLIATSANPSGSPGFTAPGPVRDCFEGKIDLIIDGGETGGRLPSTILDLTGKEPAILRDGALPRADLAPYLRL